MTMTRTALGASAALALALTLSACGGDAPADGGSSVTAPSTSTSSPTATESSSPSDDDNSTTPTDSATSAPADGGTGTSTDDRTASGLAAITTAESETGGVAYAIDDSDDDGGWEVTVRTGDSSVEVRVGADGAVVGTEPDDLDGDDRQILDGVQITLVQAIEAAVAETGGVLDDADLSDDDDDQASVEVTVDTADRTDVDVHLDPVTGEVLRVS